MYPTTRTSSRTLTSAILTIGLLAHAPLAAPAVSAQQIYWGDDVPSGWNGQWPESLRTVPERTDFTRTMATIDLHEYIVQLELASQNVHVVEMFTSPLRKVAPAIVLADPRVTSPRQAAESGKPVVFLMGNIHPPESRPPRPC